MSLVGTESQFVDRYRRFEEIRGHQVRWSCEGARNQGCHRESVGGVGAVREGNDHDLGEEGWR